MKKISIFLIVIFYILIGQGVTSNINAVETSNNKIDYIKISDNAFMKDVIMDAILSPYQITDDGLFIGDRWNYYIYDENGKIVTTYAIAYVVGMVNANTYNLIQTPNHTVPIDDAEIRVGVCIKEGTF